MGVKCSPVDTTAQRKKRPAGVFVCSALFFSLHIHETEANALKLFSRISDELFLLD